MRKASLLVVACAVAVVGGIVPRATAAPDDVNGPACADIVSGSFGIGSGTLGGTVETAAPACKFVTYTLYVSGQAFTTGIPLADDRVVGFMSAYSASNACVYVTSSVGAHVFDRAPDTGCRDAVEGGPVGGFGGFD